MRFFLNTASICVTFKECATASVIVKKEVARKCKGMGPMGLYVHRFLFRSVRVALFHEHAVNLGREWPSSSCHSPAAMFSRFIDSNQY